MAKIQRTTVTEVEVCDQCGKEGITEEVCCVCGRQLCPDCVKSIKVLVEIPPFSEKYMGYYGFLSGSFSSKEGLQAQFCVDHVKDMETTLRSAGFKRFNFTVTPV